MHPNPQPPQPRKRRLPKWLKITLAVFGVLFLLGAIFGKESAPTSGNTVAQPTTATSTTSPAPLTYVVTAVSDGATLDVSASDGTKRSVRVLGVTAPKTGIGCHAGETLTWATATLASKAVQITAETAQGVSLALVADGVDYATAAIQGGYVKYAAEAASAVLQAAEAAARQASKGLWGAPCLGTIDAPAPAAPTPPAQPTPKETPKPEPAPEPEPEPEPNKNVYYKNCDAARAANAAPIHRGEPGYRPGLDRDNDGTACDK